MTVRILLGDVRAKLAELPDESVHCVVTSPPYFGLRDYGVEGQIGLEPTPAEFVGVMVEVFREVRRVLRKDGTLWLNLGDSYWNGGGVKRDGGHGFVDGGKTKLEAAKGALLQAKCTTDWPIKPKDIMGIPWRVAFALQADGWYLRQDIIWAKPNPMPESVTDRCTKAHEYLFLLSKSARYYYDAEAIAEGVTESTVERLSQPNLEGKRNRRSVWTVATQPFKEAHFATFPPDLIEPCIKAGCPKVYCAKCGAPVVREVERIDNGRNPAAGMAAVAATGGAITGGTERSTLGHGGKFNGQSVTTGWSPSCSCNNEPVMASDWPRWKCGTVLDPFGGAGTTGLVADRLQRDAILIELNPAYAEIARERIKADSSMFAEVA